jgi:hypothetical protein
MGFFVVGMKPHLEAQLILDPYMVLQGEWWRVITFFTIPLGKGIWMAIYFLFLYFMLSRLEAYWGEFKLTMYFLIAWLGTVLASLLLGFPVMHFAYIQITFLFALATIMPDHTIYLFFVLPVKLKWIGIVSAVIVAGGPFIFGSWLDKLYVVLGGLNYLLFFGSYQYKNIKNYFSKP